ncbi:transmembrane protein 53-like isoform X2 [Clavelina lepadiformis]|uniref:transmembrane protein 53-like isoform X2 n=1 Tax=Clavelina lepadiformis TaxID=159417 RepID=UPI0040414CD8
MYSSSLAESVNQRPRSVDQDDIDYNITFPSATSEEAEPVVFLLGWVGSKDKHVAKYSAIYEKEGCITVRYIHPSTTVFYTDPSHSEEHEKASVKLAQLLDDYDLTDHPVFVHVFSNGGYFLYRYLADVFHKNQVNVAGCILDSCPGKLEYLVAVKAILSGFPNKLVSYVAVFAFTFYYFALVLKYSLGFGKRKLLFQAMQCSPFHSWPHLFLYSTADGIVPHQHVEEMAKSRKAAGALFVQQHNFASSLHVQHFRQFPQVYTEKCIHFLHDCLRAYDCEDINDDSDAGPSEGTPV